MWSSRPRKPEENIYTLLLVVNEEKPLSPIVNISVPYPFCHKVQRVVVVSKPSRTVTSILRCCQCCVAGQRKKGFLTAQLRPLQPWLPSQQAQSSLPSAATTKSSSNQFKTNLMTRLCERQFQFIHLCPFPPTQADKPTPSMSESSCKRPSCCCIVMTVVAVIIIAISAPIASQLLSGDTTITPGDNAPGSIMDLHKSMIDCMSLLSFSSTSGAEESVPTWLLIATICGAATISIFGYMYHKKIRLPRRRTRREEQRLESARNERNQAFLEKMMRDGSNPSPI